MQDVMTSLDTVDDFIEKYGHTPMSVFRIKRMLDNYFMERTCHMTLDIDYPCAEDGCKRLMLPKWICSECEWEQLGDKPNYCSNCGRKAVEE